MRAEFLSRVGAGLAPGRVRPDVRARPERCVPGHDRGAARGLPSGYAHPAEIFAVRADRLSFPMGARSASRFPARSRAGSCASTSFSIPAPKMASSRTGFRFPSRKADLERGRERYNIYCTPCHDYTGSGHGMIVQRGFPQPPSYHIQRLRDAPVGHFYQVMTNGFGAMYSYAARIESRGPLADRSLHPRSPAERERHDRRRAGCGQSEVSASGTQGTAQQAAAQTSGQSE